MGKVLVVDTKKIEDEGIQQTVSSLDTGTSSGSFDRVSDERLMFLQARFSVLEENYTFTLKRIERMDEEINQFKNNESKHGLCQGMLFCFGVLLIADIVAKLVTCLV
jgi:hypothetical protein